MFHTLTKTSLAESLRIAASQAISLILKIPRLAFVSGPRILLTARITGKCAALMSLLLVTSLLSCLFILLPPVLFQSPQQNAYFYFAEILDRDPSRWFSVGLSVLCVLIALTIPAAMPRQRLSVSY